MQQSYDQIINEMKQALSANINYLKNSGSSQIRIKNGKFIGASGEAYRYEFELEYLQDIEVDADVEVKIGQRSNSGKVVALTDTLVTISTEEHLGDTIPLATLIISSYYLLERLKEHLDAIQNGNAKHSKLAQVVFGNNPASTHEDMSYAAPQGIDDKIDNYQEEAIRTALGSDVTYIWGPPGTGKSATISNLLKTLVDRNLSVLLIAHTNAATDSVLETVVELMERENHPVYNDGKILRVGNSKSVVKSLLTKKVMPEVIVAEKARPIRIEIDSLKDALAKANTRLTYYSKAESKYRSLNELDKTIKKSQTYVDVTSSEVATINMELKNLESLISSRDEQIRLFQSKGRIGQLISGTNLQKLTNEKSGYLRQQDLKKQNIDGVSKSLKSAKEVLTTLIRRRDELSDKINNLPYPYSIEKVNATRSEISKIAAQIKALEKAIEELEEGLFDDAQVIATTLTKTYMHQPIIKREFDCVILDEASMAPLPAVLSVSGLARKKVVLVGDFLQLPPIAKHEVDVKNLSDDEADKERKLVDSWLKRDVFNVVGIEDGVRRGSDPAAWLKMLQTQYRMHPDISEIINKLVYAKNNKKFELKNGSEMVHNGEKLLGKLPLANAHFGVYNTSSIGSIPSKSDSGSTYNLTHALIAVEMAKQAVDSGYKKIGIISSYRAQVNLMKKILEDVLGKDSDEIKRVEVDTVHRFQGGAKQVIIFDVTTPYTNTMYDDGKDDGDDAKLINVAFSRAREKCIILADCKVVYAKHSESSLIRKALDIAKERNRPFTDAIEVTNEYRADDRSEHWLSKLTNTNDIVAEIENAKLFDELDFYPNFQRDLKDAEQEIIIQSAFITLNRLESLMPIFRHALDKGVRIFVITRVPWEHDGQMQEQSKSGIAMLENAGIIVLPFMGKIHQKFAIIDRTIMWDGSLNILSFRDSKETMRRLVGSATAAQYMEFQKLDKNLGSIGQNNLKHCDVCKEPSAWMWTKKGSFGRPWTYCLIGNHAAGKPPKTEKDRKQYQQAKQDTKNKAANVRAKIKLNAQKQLVCPEHNRIMQEKNGRFGQYWECPLVKECACTASAAFRNKLLKT